MSDAFETKMTEFIDCVPDGAVKLALTDGMKEFSRRRQAEDDRRSQDHDGLERETARLPAHLQRGWKPD